MQAGLFYARLYAGPVARELAPVTGADLPDTPTIQLWELACLR